MICAKIRHFQENANRVINKKIKDMITKATAKEIVNQYCMTETSSADDIMRDLMEYMMIAEYMYPSEELVKDVVKTQTVIMENYINNREL